MKKLLLLTSSLCLLPVSLTFAQNNIVNELMKTYVTQGASTADIKQGQLLWEKKFTNKGEFRERSCSSCHTQDLTVSGKHIKTNKLIKPMAPTINPERLTKINKIEKWFKRNCKWTMGRECTAQEKANFLVYINSSTNL
ncbi:MAG: DUF1924 domain-containing protein [Gammaproteobacteria bacterium]|nr:DUF1924 domain-containing protein [Gammaproteobacteria bacterium]